MLHEVIPDLIRMGYDIDITDLRKYAPIIQANIDETFLEDSGITLREYQYNSVNKLVANSGGIARIATGGGKSFTCAAIAKIYNRGRVESSGYCAFI